MKELRWHKKIPGCLDTTAADGLNGTSSDEFSSQSSSKLFQCEQKVRYSKGQTVSIGINRDLLPTEGPRHKEGAFASDLPAT